jgi:hypothetical protein
LLVNPRSGDGKAGRVGLVEAARARGVRVHLLAEGDDPGALAVAAEERAWLAAASHGPAVADSGEEEGDFCLNFHRSRARRRRSSST